MMMMSEMMKCTPGIKKYSLSFEAMADDDFMYAAEVVVKSIHFRSKGMVLVSNAEISKLLSLTKQCDKR